MPALPAPPSHAPPGTQPQAPARDRREIARFAHGALLWRVHLRADGEMPFTATGDTLDLGLVPTPACAGTGAAARSRPTCARPRWRRAPAASRWPCCAPLPCGWRSTWRGTARRSSTGTSPTTTRAAAPARQALPQAFEDAFWPGCLQGDSAQAALRRVLHALAPQPGAR